MADTRVDPEVFPAFLDESGPNTGIPENINDREITEDEDESMMDNLDLIKDNTPIEQKLASGFFGNIQDAEPQSLTNLGAVMRLTSTMKLEAKSRLQADLVHPDAERRGRTGDWYHRMSAEQRAEYDAKYPRTKFKDKTRLVEPESNPDAMDWSDTSLC